ITHGPHPRRHPSGAPPTQPPTRTCHQDGTGVSRDGDRFGSGVGQEPRATRLPARSPKRPTTWGRTPNTTVRATVMPRAARSETGTRIAVVSTPSGTGSIHM